MNESTAQILVVDDEMRICKSIKALLEAKREGLIVQIAQSVREAIALSQQIDFDLFLIDKNLPEADGFVFMDYALKHYPNALSIIMTGNASIDSVVQALRKGAYDYLRKPFKYEELDNVVSRALAQKRLKDENQAITLLFNASEKRYRELIQHSPDLIFMLDKKGMIRFANNTAVTLLGYSQMQLQKMRFVDLVHASDVESVQAFLNNDYVVPFDTITHEKRRAVDDKFHLDTHKSQITTNNESLDMPLTDNSFQIKESGPQKHFSDVALDIRIQRRHRVVFDRKFIDLEIKRSNIILYESVSTCHEAEEQICIVGRDIGFRKAFEEQMIYSQKMEAVAALAGGVAHDFNNLLMGIRGYTSLLKNTLVEDKACHAKLMAIEKSLAKGSDMTGQLLNFARGGGGSETRLGNINVIIKEALNLFSINQKGVDIHLNLEQDLWRVEMDACQMEQVFLNMFINAGHAMKKRGNLYITSENVYLGGQQSKRMKLSDGSYVKISIKDTGHGIPAEHQKKIFDPFFSTKKTGEGSGLGLASAYGIIKKHKGSISVASAPGKGALFEIYLRAVSEKRRNKKCSQSDMSSPIVSTKKRAPLSAVSAVSAPAFEEKSRPSKQLKVLIIDDEPEIQNSVRESLEGMGGHAMGAANGREGIQTYMAYMDHIDLVILDMVMPGMSGIETFRYIRKLNPAAKVLIASGYNHEQDITCMMAEGRCDFLKKPFAEDFFIQKVNHLVAME